MEAILHFFTGTLNNVAWLYIFLPCVAVGGVLLTVCTGAVQFRRFGYALRNTLGKMFKKTRADEGAVTPLQAVTTALAATVGTGNIVGTSQAIALGGYGAVFWLWIAALLGMVIKYSEVTLSIKYRRRDEKGDWVGGPMYYITNGLGSKWKWLAALYAIFAALASFGIGNMAQVNSITGSVVDAANAFFSVSERGAAAIGWGCGAVLAALVAVISMGGIKRIGSVTEKLIPLRSILYLVLTLIVIIAHASTLGGAFGKIFASAFKPRAVMGAGAGIALREALVWGLRRSAFSNEAGLGSAAIAHAAAQTPSPVAQGLYGIFEVFVDTIVICSMTALAIIVSGVDIAWGVMPGSTLIMNAFSTVFGEKLSALFIAVCLVLFAFTTVIGWSLYGTRCVQYLFGVRATRAYQLIFALVIVVGCVSPVGAVWDVADTFNGLMAIPNFMALFALAETVGALTREHFSDPAVMFGDK